MQIFEITAPRHNIKEVSAGAAGLSSFATGLASTLGSSGGAASGVAGAIGAAARPTPGAAGSQSADLASAEITQQMASAMAVQLQKAWNTEVQKWMQTYEVPSVAAASQTEKAALKGALKVLVDKMIVVSDYTQFPSMVADDADTQAAARQIVSYITSAIDAIFDVTSGVLRGDIKNEFLSLAAKGIGPALNMKQFNPKAQTDTVRTANLTSDAKNLASQMGMTQTKLNRLTQTAQQSPEKTLSAFKELVGIK